MKVLFAATHLNIGGIANYMMILGKALLAKGVVPLVVSSGGDLEGEFARRGIEAIKVDFRTKSELSPKVIAGAVRLAGIVREKQIDVIHAHTRVTQVASAIVSRFTGVPYVTTCHGFFEKRLGRMLFGCWGEKVIAISGPVRDNLMADFKVAPNKIEVVYNGIELDKFSKVYSEGESAGLKFKLGLGAGPVVGTIGRLSPVKGHRFFIEALANLLSRGYNVQGVIVGDGPEEERLKRLANDLNIGRSFSFISSSLDTAAYLAAMDIFVFPSSKEGLGMSLLEAMAAGRPCIASRVGGISDIIKDGRTGMLFPVGDVKRLGNSIIQLLNDEPLRRRLGESAKELMRARFSSDMMASKVIAVYNKVVNAKICA